MPDNTTWDNIKTSLTDGLKQVFPVIGKERDLHLEDVEVKDNKDPGDYASQKQAILNKANWTVPVYGNLVLKDKQGKTLEKSKTRLLSLPRLTNRNTFIYNGNEYSIANQIRLKPGVYTNTGDDGITRSQFNVGKGANFSLWQEPAKGTFYIQFNQASIPLYPILKEIGVSDEELSSRWGKEILDSNKQISGTQYKNAVLKVYNKLTYRKDEEKETSYDVARSELRNVLNAATLDPLVTRSTLKKEYSSVTPDVLANASGKILRVNRGEEKPDDRESLVFKSVHGPDDFVRESITKGARPVLWKVKNRLNSMYGKQDGAVIKNVFAPGTLSSPLYTNINVSPLTSVAQDANPLKFIEASNRITAFGPGGIGSAFAIPESVRNIHPSQIGFIDTVRTQESDKAGIDLQLAVGVKKTGNTLSVKLLGRDGRKVRKTLQELQGKTLALPGQGGLNSSKVEAVKDGKLLTVNQSDVDYTIYGPNRMYSDSTLLVPFLSNNAGARANLGGKMGVQALPLKYREKPLVQTAANKEGLTNEAIVGRKISVQSPVDGRVTGITNQAVEITDGSGNKHSVSLYDNYIVGNKTYLNHEPVVKEGDTVKAGQLLADSNYSKGGVLSMGTNLRTLYVPYKGLSHEDAIVVSDSAAQKFTSQHMTRFDLPVDDTTVLDKDKYLAYFSNKTTPAQIDKLDARGMVKPGTGVDSGDYIIAAMRENVVNPEDAMLGKLSRKLVKPYRDVSVLWEKATAGRVVDVVANPKSITVTVRTDAPLVVGDKITNREGGKGVVATILPDAEMPKDKDGKPYEVILNPATVMSRMNIGQLLETAASKIATPDKPYAAPLFPVGQASLPDISKEVKKALGKHGVKETEEVYNASGKKVGDMFAGKQYFYKLGKTTDTNYSARAFRGSYDADMMPVRGGEEGAKGIGMLDMYALLSHNARNILRESVTSKTEYNPEYFKAIQMGHPLPPPKPTFAFEKFINYLRGAGVNVEKKGDRLKLLPLIDKDVLRLSSGKIDNALMLRTKDLSEEQGGLFDFNTTGGKTGNKWSHVELSEPVLNPLFVEPARRLLGLREKDLIGLQNNSGGKAIKDMLSKIDVDKRLEELNGAVGNLSGVKKDDAIKQIKYLKVLKESKITPADAYTIQHLPVIPPLFRPIYPSGDNGNMRVSDINNLYKQVILVNEGLGDKTLDAMPEEEKKSLRRELFNSVKALQGLDKPVSGKDLKGFIAAIKGDSPKEGFFQSRLLKKQQDITGRATIGGDPSLGLDEIKMPEDMAWTLYGPFVIGELVKSGMKIIDAETELKERTAKARALLLMVMKDRPVLLNRAPTLHKFNIMAFNPMPYPGKTLLIPPMVMKPFSADVDGDCVTNSVYYTYDLEGDGMPFSDDTKIRYKYGLVNLRDFPRKELISKSENKEVYKVPEKVRVLTMWNGKEEWLRPESFSIHKNLTVNEVVTNTSRTIHCSDDHSLITVDDNLNYVKSKAELGITIPRLRKPVGGDVECIKEIELPDVDNGKYKISDTVAADFKLGYFTGAFIGNGWINNHGDKKTAICFASIEKPVVGFLEEIISSYCDEKVHVNSISSTHAPFDGKECLHTKHTWYVKRLAYYLKENIGSGARNKHLPLFWMHTDEDFRRGLLSGLIDTDGAVCLNTAMRTRKSLQVTVNYTTTSRVLAYEIVALAHTLNLTASASITQTPKEEECYTINFTQESILMMRDKLVLKDASKRERLANFKPNKDYKRNKYTPKLPAHRRKELRDAIYSVAKRYGANKKIKTDPEMSGRCMSLYVIIGGTEKTRTVIPRPAALNIFDLNMDIFDDPFWVKWKNMVLDENIEWELITEIKPLPFITEAYDLTIPPAYTMVTESGIVVQDTMQVHVPVSEEARREALNKMFPSQNLFSILDKSPHYAPSNEAVFGLYLGTKERKGSPLKTYQDAGDVLRDLNANRIQATDPVLLQNIRTTAGSVKVNTALPPEFRDYNRVITKKSLSEILKQVGQKYPADYARIAKELKDLGDTWAFSPEASLSFKDFELPDVRDKILTEAGIALAGRRMKKDGDVIDVYTRAQDKLIPALMEEGKQKGNKFYEWAASGARGSPTQFSSIWGAPVLVTDLADKVIPRPIKRNFIEGLTPGEYFTSLYGTRKGITATKTEVQLPGALAKELVASTIDLLVTMQDCGTRKGIDFDLSDRDALDRLAAVDVRDASGNLLVQRNAPITSRIADALRKGGMQVIKARSVTTCEAPKGVCSSCAGIQEDGKLPGIGENIGTKHAMAISEPLTQMALSTKHTAGIGSKGNGIGALKTILEMPASTYTKEILSHHDGVISGVKKLPTGGHIVMITQNPKSKIQNPQPEDYLIPPGHTLLKTEGHISRGEPLTDGAPNIQDYVAIKGIEAGRNKLTDTIRDFYRSGGRHIDRRTPETVARGILNYAKVISPGDFDLVEGDVVEYNQVAPMQTKKVVSLSPGQAVGYKLAAPYGKFTEGTRVDHDVAKTLNRSLKTKKIGVYKEPAKIEPVAFGINKIPLVKKDWLSRLGFRYLENTITEGAATGMDSNIHSMNPIPALAFGAEFGQGKGFDVY